MFFLRAEFHDHSKCCIRKRKGFHNFQHLIICVEILRTRGKPCSYPRLHECYVIGCDLLRDDNISIHVYFSSCNLTSTKGVTTQSLNDNG